MKVGHESLIPYHRPGDAAVGELVALHIEAVASRGRPHFGAAWSWRVPTRPARRGADLVPASWPCGQAAQ
ncbi:MAG TPA: hypothetical protein VFQ20_06690 [Burkholderiaceae bacterium]|nr:hypothetical protein [Burkholderiaceae bacterium]